MDKTPHHFSLLYFPTLYLFEWSITLCSQMEQNRAEKVFCLLYPFSVIFADHKLYIPFIKQKTDYLYVIGF